LAGLFPVFSTRIFKAVPSSPPSKEVTRAITIGLLDSRHDLIAKPNAIIDTTNAAAATITLPKSV
jgi:hypothetical protein